MQKSGTIGFGSDGEVEELGGGEPTDSQTLVYVWQAQADSTQDPGWWIQVGETGSRMLISRKGPLRGLYFLSLILQSAAPVASSTLVARWFGEAAIDAESRQSAPQHFLDSEAKEQYRRRLDELESEIEEAAQFNDVVRLERAQVERSSLLEHLKLATGWLGKTRSFPTKRDKNYFKVHKALRALKDELRGGGLADVADHVERCVKGGTEWLYTASGDLLLVNRSPDDNADRTPGIHFADRSVKVFFSRESMIRAMFDMYDRVAPGDQIWGQTVGMRNYPGDALGTLRSAADRGASFRYIFNGRSDGLNEMVALIGSIPGAEAVVAHDNNLRILGRSDAEVIVAFPTLTTYTALRFTDSSFVGVLQMWFNDRFTSLVRDGAQILPPPAAR